MIWVKKQQSKGGKLHLFNNTCSSRANSLLLLPIFRSVTVCWHMRWDTGLAVSTAVQPQGMEVLCWRPLRPPGRSWNRVWLCWCGNELMSMSQDMPGPTCQLTRDELEVTNSRKSSSNTVLGNVSSPAWQIQNKAMKINGPKERGH